MDATRLYRVFNAISHPRLRVAETVLYLILLIGLGVVLFAA